MSTDHWSRAVEVEPAWFTARCTPARKPVRVPTGGGGWRTDYEVIGGGCGYLTAKGARSASPVYLTKDDARRVAARHRREHRKEEKQTD